MLSKENKVFILAMIGMAFLCYLYFVDDNMTYFNSTLYAFSYDYGFIPRAFMGSIFQLVNAIVPFDLMNYNGIYLFSQIGTFLFYIFTFLFFISVLKKTDKDSQHTSRLLMVFFGVFTFPMFITSENFGRIDIYFFILIYVSLMLIINNKAEWLIVPIIIVCMCIHEGFTFTSANIILVLLFYKALTDGEKINKKYMSLFLICFAIVSVLFVYFEFLSKFDGTTTEVEQIIRNAKLLSRSGKKYNETIINHELLGMDVFESERAYHICNYQETPVFLALFFPYILIAFSFFKRLLSKVKGKEFVAYLFVVIGPLTMVPDLILKVDYGRYAHFTFFYYIAIVLVLIALKDQKVIDAMRGTTEAVKKKLAIPYLLIAYPMIFMPFSDWYISDVSLAIMDAIKLFVRTIF